MSLPVYVLRIRIAVTSHTLSAEGVACKTTLCTCETIDSIDLWRQSMVLVLECLNLCKTFSMFWCYKLPFNAHHTKDSDLKWSQLFPTTFHAKCGCALQSCFQWWDWETSSQCKWVRTILNTTLLALLIISVLLASRSRGQDVNLSAVKRSRSRLRCGQTVKQQKRWSNFLTRSQLWLCSQWEWPPLELDQQGSKRYGRSFQCFSTWFR